MKPNFLQLVMCLALWGWCVSPLLGEETVETLFQKAVESSGKEYAAARSKLLARSDGAAPMLDEAIKTSTDWRSRVTALALRGWINHPEQYRELWDWEAPKNERRNPFPLMAAQTRVKFAAAGKDAVPLMLELLLKKRDAKYGAIPQVLAQLKEESAIAVLVEFLSNAPNFASTVPDALGSFGKLSTPPLLSALRDVNPQSRPGLIMALGRTNDLKAVDAIRTALMNDPDERTCEQAAKSLGELKAFSELREDLPKVAAKTQREILGVLASDKSDETRDVLRNFAKTAAHASLRSEAVRALLHSATADDVAMVCEIVPHEPDDTQRSNMYLYLGEQSKYRASDAAKEAFLRGLKDQAELARLRAMEGLKVYDEPEVNQALLPQLAGNDSDKRTALWALVDRQDPVIVDAVIPFLKDKEALLRMYAAAILSKNRAESALKPLIELLSDSNLHTRRYAVDALVLIGGDEALAALKVAFPEEKEELVRRRLEVAIESLSHK
jgi:HEAT repeat protein